ncbi:peptidyl-prolyl cis-trans isomerase [Bariatricus sp. SGI.154]|uniref:peptidyl-prolyl cis-trans isomerase n=1 Tax=Bariatricus sp. SGI.154 TaxID=3420549 RepID=UPI003D004298
MKRKILVLAMAGMMAVTSLTGCGSLKEDDVAVTVNDKEITAGVANFYARYVQAQYETYYSAYLGDDMWNSEASEGKTYEESVKDSVLKELETMVLLEEHMDEYEVSLSDEEKEVIDKSVKEFDEANALDDKELVSGSKETVKRIMTLMAIQQKMKDAIQAGVDTEVSDEEAAQKSMQYVLFSYTSTDENGESVDLTDEEKAEVKNQATAFAEGAKAAEDFSAYATEQGAEAKTATFDAESTSPSEDLIKAADALEEGGVTDVIETDTGCYVAKVTSLLDREATDSKKQTIISEREQQLYTDTCDEWLDKAEIKVHESVWKKIDFSDMSVTIRQDDSEPYADTVQTDDVADSGSESE